jgi:hypothetical protein
MLIVEKSTSNGGHGNTYILFEPVNLRHLFDKPAIFQSLYLIVEVWEATGRTVVKGRAV